MFGQKELMLPKGQIIEAARGALQTWDPPDQPLVGAWTGEAGNHCPEV